VAASVIVLGCGVDEIYPWQLLIANSSSNSIVKNFIVLFCDSLRLEFRCCGGLLLYYDRLNRSFVKKFMFFITHHPPIISPITHHGVITTRRKQSHSTVQYRGFGDVKARPTLPSTFQGHPFVLWCVRIRTLGQELWVCTIMEKTERSKEYTAGVVQDNSCQKQLKVIRFPTFKTMSPEYHLYHQLAADPTSRGGKT
jgi:hypothetical protein